MPTADSRVETCCVAARACAVIAIVGGALVLLGWAFDIRALKQPLPVVASMKANTAASLAMSGLALWFLSKRTRPRVQTVLGVFVALVGFVSLTEDVFAFDAGIDQLLFADDASAVATSAPGRMSPITAICFQTIGASLAVSSLGWPRPAQALAVVSATLSLIALLGYLYDVRALYGVGLYTTMAVHTAALHLLLACGVLLAHPESEVMHVIAEQGPGGSMARRLLPAAVLLPVGLGWLRLIGQRRGYYGTEFGLALFVVSVIVAFTLLIWRQARSIGLIDAERRRIEDDLRHMAASLEGRVVEQTREITGSLREKEILLKEVHHRVKNNMQIVSSLLRLQSMHVHDPEAVRALRESEERVMSMALLHESLYQANDLARVDVTRYLRSLANELLNTHGAITVPVTITTTSNVTDLEIEKAVPVGLLVNELVTNSLKHGFPTGRGGTIDVHLVRGEGTYVLTVSDNGVGMPAKPRARDSLGLSIVAALSTQLGGRHEFTSHAGTEFRLEFPK
jgi:two-component sensor histidine kinase